MTSQVRIVRGEYHYKPVSGVFQMTKPLTTGGGVSRLGSICSLTVTQPLRVAAMARGYQ